MLRAARWLAVLTLLLSPTLASAAELTPVGWGLVVMEEDQRAPAEEAIKSGLAEQNCLPDPVPGLSKSRQTEEQLRVLSRNRGNDPVLQVVIEQGKADRLKVSATAAAGAVTVREARTADREFVHQAAGELAASAAGQIRGLTASGGGGILSSGPGFAGVVIGSIGTGLFLLAYIPAIAVGSSYSDWVPDAGGYGKVPLVGPFLARGRLSDELLQKGGSAGLIADGLVQFAGVGGMVTGASMMVYAWRRDASERGSSNDATELKDEPKRKRKKDPDAMPEERQDAPADLNTSLKPSVEPWAMVVPAGGVMGVEVKF